MKATYFKDNIEWQITTKLENWFQGATVDGEVSIKNHSQATISLSSPSIGLTFEQIKKVQAREILKPSVIQNINLNEILPGQTHSEFFSLKLPANCPITDKKAGFYLSFGLNANDSHLLLNVKPLEIYTKIISLFETFQRFKVKEVKSAKSGVEFKLIPPTSRELANMEGLSLEFTMNQDTLIMTYNFSMKKLDMSGITTKMTKVNTKEVVSLTVKEYSLGKDMINQDALLKSIENVMSKIKANVF